MIIVQLQQTLKLIFCLIADMLQSFKKGTTTTNEKLVGENNGKFSGYFLRPVKENECCLSINGLLLVITQASDSDLFWCSILPVHPPLLPVWTHHVPDYRLSCKWGVKGSGERSECVPNSGTFIVLHISRRDTFAAARWRKKKKKKRKAPWLRRGAARTRKAQKRNCPHRTMFFQRL